MFPSYLKVEKNGSQLFGALQTLLQLFGERKKWIPAIWRTKNVVHNCQELEKDYDIYLKSENLVHSLQEHEKYVSQLFGIGKNWILAISSLTITVAVFGERKMCIPDIWRPKNVVHNSQEQGKRL